MPLLFLLLIAFATGALSAHAGRDEVRQSAEPIWRWEAFLAYAMFVGFVLLPTAIYFYVFHGDWFLHYLIDTGSARWAWGLLACFLVLGAAALGFRVGATLCRASRDRAVLRITLGVFVAALAVWPLCWQRIALVGSYRQYTRDYGLTEFFASPAFYSGVVTLIIASVAFAWVAFRIDRQTQDPASS